MEKRKPDFTPYPWQIAAWKDHSPVMLLTGSAGGGKSRLWAEKVHGFCLKHPNATCLLLRKAAEWCSKSITPFYQHIAGKQCTFKNGYFQYANGSTVYVGGMLDHKQREAVRSIGAEGGLDMAVLEEGNAFARLDFDELRARLRHQAAPWRQIIVSTNPDAPGHWIYTDLLTGGQASVHYSHAADNPANAPEYLATLAGLQGVLKDRLALGKWVQAEGAIYVNFDFATHVKVRPDSEMVRWHLALDEGYENPAVILLVGEDSDGRLHVKSEFYQSHVLQDVVIAECQKLSKLHKLSSIIVDDAAAGLIAALRKAGLYATGAKKGRVFDGIQVVQRRLTSAGDGRPRVTIAPECVNILGELPIYAWKPGSKDEPLKANDHALDALRYLSVALERPQGAFVWKPGGK
jgi:phage terminase large subunit